MPQPIIDTIRPDDDSVVAVYAQPLAAEERVAQTSHLDGMKTAGMNPAAR
jgi:hypothetical protein